MWIGFLWKDLSRLIRGLRMDSSEGTDRLGHKMNAWDLLPTPVYFGWVKFCSGRTNEELDHRH